MSWGTIDPFAYKLFLSFIVGGLWTVVGTAIGERSGTKAGGVIAGMPSAIVVALFFIGWTQSPEVASEATTLVPLVLAFIALFCVVYVLLYPTGFARAIVVGLAFWFAVSLGIVFAGVNRFSHSLIGWAVIVPSCYIVFEKVLRIPSAGRRTNSPTWRQLLFRSVLGGFGDDGEGWRTADRWCLRDVPGDYAVHDDHQSLRSRTRVRHELHQDHDAERTDQRDGLRDKRPVPVSRLWTGGRDAAVVWHCADQWVDRLRLRAAKNGVKRRQRAEGKRRSKSKVKNKSKSKRRNGSCWLSTSGKGGLP